MEVINGKIIGYDERTGQLKILAPYADYYRMAKREYRDVEIGLQDGRKISPEQRRKAYALMAEISEWCGETPEYIKRHMKLDFIVNRLEGMKEPVFSLANCDMTTAREYISHLIDFVFEHDVPLKVPILTLCDDLERCMIAALMHKRCPICGKKADLHHYDAIGMGNKRTEVYQIGMRVVSLCRECHTTAHSKGREWLTKEQHLLPMPLTKEIGKAYGLTKKNLEASA